ncbi:MAG: polysaccharide deacetylase family protein [Bacteroidales bacterium]|nr:polysaccharide deacetylase family protein [Bacteroidales bacterium]MBN2819851.1 polysaccharide deacetylase family protein [Bacteroidales bacterium]
MKNTLIIFFFFLIMTNQNSNAQQEGIWNGKKCAVVLTYDDALNVHLDNVIPCLDSFGINGTFYIIGESEILRERLPEWKTAAANGHELGNHSLTHPCDGGKNGRSWVSKESDLRSYSVHRAVNEIRITNTLLYAIDGKTERTFAYPCADKYIDTVAFYNELGDEFPGARGVYSKMQHLSDVDLSDIPSYMIMDKSADYMINLVKEAQDTHTLLVFLFHGVGGEHNINVSLEEHNKLVHYLVENEDEIWIAPLVDVAKYIKEEQENK